MSRKRSSLSDPMSLTDDDAHVVMRDRVTSLSTVLLATRFSEDAREATLNAERALETARLRAVDARAALAVKRLTRAQIRERRTELSDADHDVVLRGIVAGQALDYLIRATVTLEQAVRLHAMGQA